MDYVIFGTGRIGKYAYDFFGKDRIAFFVDNNKHYEGELFLDKKLISAHELLKEYDPGKQIVIIATIRATFALQIAKQLDDLGVPYRLFEEEAENYIASDENIYRSMKPRKTFQIKEDSRYYLTLDRNDDAGRISSDMWQDLWTARKIHAHSPNMHYDIGSRVDGFITHLLSFGQPVTMLDIRPLPRTLPGLVFQQADATELDTVEDDSIESLSALCSLEHFGLGRYGDPIDPDSCFRCFDAIQKKMKKGGYFYMSVPIGTEHLEFNAHRVFFASTIIDAFDRMDLVEFSSCYKWEYEENIPIDRYDNWNEFGGERFGLFCFIKK